LTDFQFEQMNLRRAALSLHLLEQNEIIFIGKHLFSSRAKDGYTIDDIIDQIVSALSDHSVVNISPTWSRIDNPTPRSDRYGNSVMDRGVFEMTAKKPRAEQLVPRPPFAPNLRLVFLLQLFGMQTLGFLGHMFLSTSRPCRIAARRAAISSWSSAFDPARRRSARLCGAVGLSDVFSLIADR
jgi:hypothetical protein